MSDFDMALAHTLIHEGGWSDNRRDPGGATMQGVTLRVYREYFGRTKSKSDLRHISDGELKHIYKNGYWDLCRCDELPSGVDLAVFDYAVNSGPSRSCKALQKVVGTKQDGLIGPITLNAVMQMRPSEIISRLIAARLGFLHRLSSWRYFGRGWTRRVKAVKAQAIRMAQNQTKIAA